MNVPHRPTRVLVQCQRCGQLFRVREESWRTRILTCGVKTTSGTAATDPACGGELRQIAEEQR